jgi:hypothetical protein
MEAKGHDVRVAQDGSAWVVSLDSVVVGKFFNAIDALSLASVLECSPRARADALSKN